MCPRCLAQQVNIVDGLEANGDLIVCQECGRSHFHQRWLTLEPESPEFLTLCVKKIKGIGKKLKLIDAKFVWTEPHSKRIKVRVTVEAEVLSNVVVRQATIVEFKQVTQMCNLCRKANLDQPWDHCIQVRQACDEYRKTFRRLEQELIKAGMDKHIVSVEEKNNGFDLFFAGRGDSKLVLDYLKSSLPLTQSSQPTKHGATHTHTVQIPPLNKFDLVIVPEVYTGGSIRLFLLKRITSSLHFIDLQKGEHLEISGSSYWKYQSKKSNPSGSGSANSSKAKGKVKSRSIASSTGGSASVNAVTSFTALLSLKNLIEYVVIESVPLDSLRLNSYPVIEVTVARESDFGVNNESFVCRSYLTSLQSGDSVLGFDLTNLNLTDAHIEALQVTGFYNSS